jgi:Domain of unknown function (DU1801)
MPSRAKSPSTVAEFLAGLPALRRREVDRVRALIRQHIPAGYEEVITKGMLVYQVPLARYSETYNGQPLWYVALASGKSYLSLHLMSVYGDAAQAKRLKDGFRTAGKKLDMGKACVHFQRADDLAQDVIATIIGSVPVERWVAIAQAARRGSSGAV